jgi:hypothetical protein
VRIEEQKLLLRYARLMLSIAQAQNPNAKIDITPKTIQLSGGYKKLRTFYVRLSDRRKADYRRFLQATLDGVDALMAKAEATGEAFTLADIEIDVFDAMTGRTVKAPDIHNEEQDNGTGNDSDEQSRIPHERERQNAAPGTQAADSDRGDHEDRQDPRSALAD